MHATILPPEPVVPSPTSVPSTPEPGLRALLEAAPHAAARFDRSRRLTYLNAAARALLGADAAWTGRPIEELATRHPVFAVWEAAVGAALERGEARTWEHAPRGGPQLRTRVAPEPGTGGAAAGALLWAEEVPERAAEGGGRTPRHDALSGALDRTTFLARLEEASSAHAAGGAPFAVLFVDLDRFKGLNDRYGHAFGDAVLGIVGERLLASVRPADPVGRLGGDEFAVLLHGVADVEVAVGAVQRIQRHLARPMDVDGTAASVTASVGLALATEIGDPRALLAGADRAMYSAKGLGDGHYQVLDPAAAAHEEACDAVGEALQRAVRHDELTVHYQPVVSLSDGRLMGLEALVRWNHPERGLLGPQAFLPVAERSGLVAEVDRWVLAHVAGQLRRWEDAFPSARVPVSVNLSPRHPDWPDVCDHVAALLDEHGVAPARLIVEITESALLDLGAGTVSALARLSRRGVRVCLDDFGTGFSSLSHLRRLAVDLLKVDRSFVQRILAHPADRAIVGSVIQLAHTLGMPVVAEGIETESQAEVLRALGCDQGQGWRFGRPVPAAEVERLLAGG